MSVGYIYIIKEIDTNYHKVGLTKDEPIKRLTQLQTGNPRVLKIVAYFTVSNTRKIESLLHSILGKYHVMNEWFLLSDDKRQSLIAYIERNLTKWQGNAADPERIP